MPTAVIKSATKMDYTPLVVRLAGFSVFFVALSPQLQMEIISRTEHRYKQTD
jgi:pyruvate-formate lyase